MGFFAQLKLLVWKNYTLRKRQWFRLILEILFPLALFIILVIVRTRPDLKTNHNECHFDGKAMPSAGTLPFLQSMICTLNTPCHDTVTAGERAGVVDTYNSSLLSTLVRDFERIIGNEADVRLIRDIITDLGTINQTLQLLQNQSTVGGITIGNVLVSPQNLTQQVQGQNISISQNALQQLLNASINPSQLNFSTINELLTDFDDQCTLPDRSRIQNISGNLPANMSTPTVDPNTVSASNLQNIICAPGRLTQILNFADPAAADTVHTELCNMTLDDFLKLFDDFRRDIDPSLLENELRRFAEVNTGRELVSDPVGTVERLLTIFNETQQFYYDYRQVTANELNLQALMKPFTDLRDALSGNGDIMQSLGVFACGRASQFTSLMTDSSSETTASNDEEQPENQRNQIASSLNAGLKRAQEVSEEQQNHTCNRRIFYSRKCQRLYSSITGSGEIGQFISRQLSPFIRGYIHYYPDTPEVRKILVEANRTFDDLASFSQLTLDVAMYSVELENVLGFLTRFTNSCVCDLLLNTTRDTNISSLPLDFLLRSMNLPQSVNISMLERYQDMLKSNQSLCRVVHDMLVNNPLDVNLNTGANPTANVNLVSMVAMMQNVAGTIADYSQCFNYNKFRGFTDYETFVKKSQKRIIQNRLLGALQFDTVKMDPNGRPQFVDYRIRMDPSKVDSTKKVRDKYWTPGPRNGILDTKYTVYGFSYLQDMIDHAIIRLQTDTKEDVGIVLQMFPYPCYIEDKFIMAISRSLPLFLVLAWVLTVALITKNVVHEKEKRLKEVMKIMGLGNAVHWLAWFINAFVVMFFTIILLTIVVKGGGVIEHSDPSVLLVFFTLFGISTIMECFLISTFFNQANLAACCAGFVYFLLYLPYTLAIQWEEFMNNGHKFVSCLSSGVAFGFGCSYIAKYEEQAVGMQWHNLATTPVIDDNFNMAICMVMMIFDTFLYGLATWYIEAVFPGQYGIPRKWYFPIQKSYWCGTSGKSTRDGSSYAVGSYNMDGTSQAKNMEAEPTSRPIGVSIRNLKKVYNEGKKTAVDGLSLNFYEGQITSFLGHNGAGKTTTMSILTGLFPPTEGTAYIYGKDIRTETDDIRKSLGMCPQHNVLFDHLTVAEHLWFFARLKGLDADKVKKETEQMIKDVGLPHKRNEVSSSLSGGMKRKLSVAMAFVGDAKTVILDEPTAGVDPYARRSIWELLFKVKKNRTIILSTHHMDEADVLGDRIAIISQGKLCCCGSSLFLKSCYGNGYYLTMVRSNGTEKDDSDIESDDKEEMKLPKGKQDKIFSYDERPMSAGSIRSGRSVQSGYSLKSGNSIRTIVEVEPSVAETEDEGYQDGATDRSESDPPTPPPEGATMVPGFSVSRVSSFVKKYVKGSRLVEDNNTEMTFQLPDAGASTGEFKRLFRELERCHKDLGISSFGVSDTSLEEVFLKVSEETMGEDVEDEFLRKKQEEISDGGRFPRSVTRLSHRRKKKKSFLKILKERTQHGKGRVDTDDLLGDTESVVSEGAVSEAGDTGFNHKDLKKITGKLIYLRQFIAIFIKRFHHVRRSKKGFLCEIILPAVFILLAMIFAELSPPVTEEPKLELHPWYYVPKMGDKFLYMFYSDDGSGMPESTKNINTMLQKPGIGNRCMNTSVYHMGEYPCQSDWRAQERLSWHPEHGSAAYPSCSCETYVQQCPSGAGGPVPPKTILSSSDRLFNMTNRNISDWLVKTTKTYSRRRFGGFSIGDTEPQAVELMKAMENASQFINFTSPDWKWLKDIFVQDVNKVWYNNKGWVSVVAYANVMNNIIMRGKAPGPIPPTGRGIVTHNHPMEYTQYQLNDKLLYSSGIDVVIAICVIFAMSFIPASFTLVLIEERASNSKHLQFVSGVNPTMYWVANFAWDLLNYFVPCCLLIFIFLAFQRESYIGAVNGPCLVALLCLYGVAMIPVMYPFTRVFSIPSTAMVTLQAVNVFIGTTTTLATFILEFLQEDDEELKKVNELLQKVFLIFPQYCLGRGLMDMSRNYLFMMAYSSFGFEGRGMISPFEFDQVGKNLLALVITGVVFFIFNVMFEYNFCIRRGIQCFWDRKPQHASLANEDIDVKAERNRVMEGNDKDDVLQIKELTKVFRLNSKKGRNTAVDKLCVGVPKGQCFGLLGVNGAGKTTTFKMLTGDVKPSKGNAFVNGYSILTDMVQVNRSLGYCPQFDAFDTLLTGREILAFYARLRGVPEKDIKDVVEWAVRKLNLKQYADKLSNGYSGGNKRKLSTAISLIGNPAIIFLDEPTTGMDPRARRFLWNCINAIVKDGRSVILTSHSMEECEALCNRLGIMVNGRFLCMGSSQHLKNRFGDGYTVIIRVDGGRANRKAVQRFIKNSFPGAELKEEHNNMLQYQMPADIKLSFLFEQIQGVKEDLSIEDYSVSQTTLDQVFINFAKLQTDLLDDIVDESQLKKVDTDADIQKINGTSGETDVDEPSLAGSTVDLLPRDRSASTNSENYFALKGIDNHQYEYTDEESLAGSQVDLIPPARSARVGYRGTKDSGNVPNIDIF